MKTIITLLTCLFIVAPAYADETKQWQDDPLYKTAVNIFQQHLHSRYMEQGQGTSTSFPGWEQFPLKEYKYNIDQVGSARVILLDADPERLAKWVVTAVRVVDKEKATEEAVKALCKHINSQSNAQFPVAGIVYENMGDGWKPYAFRDGVTVKLEGINTGTATAIKKEEIDAAVFKDTKVLNAKVFARIASTTREQFKAYDKDAEVGGLEWLNVVRKEYQAAWNSDENRLITAKYKSDRELIVGGQKKSPK